MLLWPPHRQGAQPWTPPVSHKGALLLPRLTPSLGLCPRSRPAPGAALCGSLHRWTDAKTCRLTQCPCICPSFVTSTSAALVHISISPSIHPSTCPSIHSCVICPPIRLSVHPSIQPATHPSIRPTLSGACYASGLGQAPIKGGETNSPVPIFPCRPSCNLAHLAEASPAPTFHGERKPSPPSPTLAPAVPASPPQVPTNAITAPPPASIPPPSLLSRIVTNHMCLALFCTKPFLILPSEDPTRQAGQRVSFPSCPRANRPEEM